MHILKRCILLGLFLLVIIPVSFAEITITMPEKKVYSLGEKVKPEVSIKEGQNYNGFFKLRLVCDDYNFQYYTFPLSLEADVRTAINVPELRLFDAMKGTCSIKAAFDKVDDAKVNSASTKQFEVTDEIKITMDKNVEAEPGEKLTIAAKINKGSNEPFNGNIEVHFNNKKTDINVAQGNLKHEMSIESDAESGKKAMTIKAYDEFGNSGEESFMIKVLQVPTRLENQIANGKLTPGDDLKAKILLYDHKSKVIENAKINLEVFGPKEDKLTETEIESSQVFTMQTDNGFEPGAYYLLARYNGIKKQNTFTITELKKISMNREGSTVHVENTGNIKYNDEVTIILESENKNYLINKKLKLEPGEKVTIDLSKEVPSGTYDVILPEDAVETVENEVAEETTQTAEQNIIENVQIEDNRNIAKKTGSGLKAVTGSAINTAKIVASKPTLASIILITIILGIITYYSRGFIVKKIRRKKEDTSDLFSDFEFENEDSKR